MKRDPNNKKPTKLLTAVTALFTGSWNSGRCSNVWCVSQFSGQGIPRPEWRPELQKHLMQMVCQWAQKVEEEGAVLLKNDGALPLAGTNRKINLLAMLPQIRFMAVRVPVAAATLQTGQIL